MDASDRAAREAVHRHTGELVDVMLNRYRADVVFTRVGRVLLSVNPGRVVPAAPPPTSSSSTSAPAAQGPSASPSADAARAGRRAGVSTSPGSVGSASAGAAGSRAAAAPRGARPSSSARAHPPRASSASAAGDDDADADDALALSSSRDPHPLPLDVPLFHQSLMWTYAEHARKGGFGTPGQAPPPHVFGVAAAAMHEALQDGAPHTILCVGEAGSGKSEAARQALRYLCTVSRAARGRAEASVAAIKGGSAAARAYVQQGAGSAAAGGGIFPPSSSSSLPSFLPLEQLLADAHTVLDTLGSAGEGAGGARSPSSTRFLRWTRLLLGRDGALEGATVRTALLDHWRLVCPPPGAATGTTRAASASAAGAGGGAGSASAGAAAAQQGAARRYLMGLPPDGMLLVDGAAVGKGGAKAVGGGGAGAGGGGPAPARSSPSSSAPTYLHAVDTNFRVLYALLAGADDDERASLRLLDNPSDYAYLASYGPSALPRMRESHLDRERARRAVVSAAAAAAGGGAFAGAAKAYLGGASSSSSGAGFDSASSSSSSSSPFAASPLAFSFSSIGAATSADAAPPPAPAAPVPASLSPAVLAADFASLKQALGRLQLNAGAQASIFRVLSACLLLGNVQFDTRIAPVEAAVLAASAPRPGGADGLAETAAGQAAAVAAAASSSSSSAAAPPVTYVVNGEVLWSCASLLGVDMHALAHVLTHVTPSVGKGAQQQHASTSAPTAAYLQLSPAKACLVRDALAAALYRRLWNHIAAHINAVLDEAGRAHREAARSNAAPVAEFLPWEQRPRNEDEPPGVVDIVDAPGLGGVAGDGLSRTAQRSEAEAAALLASHSRFGAAGPGGSTAGATSSGGGLSSRLGAPSVVPGAGRAGAGAASSSSSSSSASSSSASHFAGPASFAHLLRHYAAEAVEQVYGDSVIAGGIAAYEREGVPHPFIHALAHPDKAAAAVAAAAAASAAMAAPPSIHSRASALGAPSSTTTFRAGASLSAAIGGVGGVGGGSSLITHEDGRLSTLSTPWAEVFAASTTAAAANARGPVPIPPLPLPDNSGILALFDTGAAAGGGGAGSAAGGVGQGGLWASLAEATRYAYPDAATTGLANTTASSSSSSSSSGAAAAAADSHSNATAALVPAHWRAGAGHADADWVATALTRLGRRAGGGGGAAPSSSTAAGTAGAIIRRPTVAEGEAVTQRAVGAAQAAATPSPSSSSTAVAASSSSSLLPGLSFPAAATAAPPAASSSAPAPAAPSGPASFASLFVLQHSHGEVAYVGDGSIANNASCACCETAMASGLPSASAATAPHHAPPCGGLPRHAQTIIGGTSTDTLVRILLADGSAVLAEPSTPSSSSLPPMPHACATAADCLRHFLHDLHASLQRSTLHWIRCIKPTDDPSARAGAESVSHDAVSRQLRTGGVLHIAVLAAFGHTAAVPLSDFYERYVTLDVSTLRKFGPFFPRAPTTVAGFAEFGAGGAFSPFQSPVPPTSVLTPATRARVALLVGDVRPSLPVPSSSRVAAQLLAESLWARLYIPQAAKLRGAQTSLPLLHPAAPLELAVGKTFMAGGWGASGGAVGPEQDESGVPGALVPFRFVDGAGGSATSADLSSSSSSGGPRAASAVAVGTAHVFMSRQYAECIEAARARAAVGMDAAARRIQARARSFVAQTRFGRLRAAVICMQARLRGRRHVRAFAFYRDRALRVKNTVLAHVQRRRFERMVRAVAMLKRAWRRARATTRLRRTRAALRSLHLLARGFVVRSAVYRWHAAAIAVQIPVRNFLARRRVQRARRLVALFSQSAWRGRAGRKLAWMETARLLALHQAHVRIRFARRVVATMRMRAIRQQYLLLRRTAVALQRWIRAVFVRRAWRKVVRAVQRIQATIRGAAGRRVAGSLRTARAARAQACEMQALRLSEARALGVLDSLRAFVVTEGKAAASAATAAATTGQQQQQQQRGSPRTGGFGGAYGDGGADDAASDDTAAGSADIAAAVAARLRAPLNGGAQSAGQQGGGSSSFFAQGSQQQQHQQQQQQPSSAAFGMSMRLLDVDVLAPLKEVYYRTANNANTSSATATGKKTGAGVGRNAAAAEDDGGNSDGDDAGSDDGNEGATGAGRRPRARDDAAVLDAWGPGSAAALPLPPGLSTGHPASDRLLVDLGRWASAPITPSGVRVPRDAWATAFRALAASLAARDKSVAAVAVGDAHSVALTSDGQLYTWGWADVGQLGHGTTAPSALPRLVASLSDPTHSAHPHPRPAKQATFLAGAGGGIVGAGGSGGGGGGGGGAAGMSAPNGASAAVAAVAGAAAALGGLGRGGPGPLALPRAPATAANPIVIAAIVAGRDHTVALSSTGVAYAWGGNSRGQCGLGHTDAVSYPVALTAITRRVVSIAAGDRHSAFLTQAGTVFTCGSGASCGHGFPAATGARSSSSSSSSPPPPDVLSPSPIRSLAGLTVAGVAAGTGHTVVVAATGEVFAWGDNAWGQCGVDGGGATAPLALVLVPTLVKASPASAAASLAAPAASAALAAQGLGGTGGLLVSDSAGTLTVSPRRAAPSSPSPSPPSAPAAAAPGTSSKPYRFVRVAAGARHTLLLTAGGRVLACGRNSHGQLGTGDRADRRVPAAVRIPDAASSSGGGDRGGARRATRASSSSPSAAPSYVVLDIAAAGDSSYAVATLSTGAGGGDQGGRGASSSSSASAPAPAPTLRGAAANLPMTLAADANRRKVFQWGHAGAVTEARVRVQLAAHAAALSTADGEKAAAAAGRGGSGGGDNLALVAEPIGREAVELLLPTPVRSMGGGGGGSSSSATATAGGGGGGGGWPSESSSSGGGPPPIVSVPVGVCAVGNTTLSVAWAVMHTLPRLTPLSTTPGGRRGSGAGSVAGGGPGSRRSSVSSAGAGGDAYAAPVPKGALTLLHAKLGPGSAARKQPAAAASSGSGGVRGY
jgi:alpha-tubulin suppressor-like RCC1 family protein